MLFHLAHPFMQGTRRVQVERAIERLIDRHGEGNYLDCTLKLTFPRNPNGVYFLKGGGPDVWRKFRVPRCWRKPLGLIHGKRCGVTENVGATARSKFKEQRGGIQREAAAPYFVSLPCAYKTRVGRRVPCYHPDYMREAAELIGRRLQNVRVIA